jgi:YHS domain-containing protein
MSKSAFVLVLFAAGCSSAASRSTAPDRLDGAAIAQSEMKKVTPSPNYPLSTCVVSGDPLGPVENRVAYTYHGTEVQFCCAHCVKDFSKDPDRYIAQVKAASK